MKAVLFIKYSYILPKQVIVLFTYRLEGIFFLYHILVHLPYSAKATIKIMLFSYVLL